MTKRRRCPRCGFVECGCLRTLRTLRAETPWSCPTHGLDCGVQADEIGFQFCRFVSDTGRRCDKPLDRAARR